MVAPMGYTPVGVARSPSTLRSVKPCSPIRPVIVRSAGCHPAAPRWNVSTVAVVAVYPAADTTITWRVPAGSVRNREAALSTGLGGAALGRTTGETVGTAVGGGAVGPGVVDEGVVDEGVSATGGLAAGEGLVGGEGEDAGVAAPECGADRVASTTPASPPAPAARPATTKTTLRHAITDPEASAGRPASGRGNAGTSPGRRTRRARRTGRARRRTYRRGVKTVVAVLACLALGGCGGPVVTDRAPGDAPSASAAPPPAPAAPSEGASPGAPRVG